jgi:hypothetical protein
VRHLRPGAKCGQRRCPLAYGVNVASWDDVRTVASTLPETTESAVHGTASWRVKDKSLAWERPLRRSDLEALGPDAPDGPILAVRVPDVGVKEALVADDPDVYFTTPHFNGYPAILVRLDRIEVAELRELLVEAWLARAPKRLAQAYGDALP